MLTSRIILSGNAKLMPRERPRRPAARPTSNHVSRMLRSPSMPGCSYQFLPPSQRVVQTQDAAELGGSHVGQTPRLKQCTCQGRVWTQGHSPRVEFKWINVAPP